MNVVILCSGEGSRFLKNGILTPKPLFKINNHPLFWWAARSTIQSFMPKKLYFSVLKKHNEKHNLSKEILHYFPQGKIIEIEKVTGGAAETAFFCCEAIKNTDPLMFVDCDLFFNSLNSLNIFINNLENKIHTIFTFKSSNPNYSYVELNNEHVIKIREKKVISNTAMAGIYVFFDKFFFIDLYKELTRRKIEGELYLSNILSILISKRYPVKIVALENHLSFGTPTEIDNLNELEIANAFRFVK